jgi:hypothetical protein
LGTGAAFLPGSTIGGISEIEAVKEEIRTPDQRTKKERTRTRAFERGGRRRGCFDGTRIPAVQRLGQWQKMDIQLLDDVVALSIREDVEPFKAVVGLLKL